MNFDLTTTDWIEIENLTNDKTYYLQSRIIINRDNKLYFYPEDILYTQSATVPTVEYAGLLDNSFRFDKKSGKNVYVKAVKGLSNIHVEEVA